MNNYALTFVVDPFNDDVDDRLLNSGMMTSVQDRLFQVMTIKAGATCLDAARDAARRVQTLGARVQRLDLDLVNQSEIAERVGLTRAAVNKWVHCTDPGQSFPTPHTAAPALLWAWGDVNEWLRRHRTSVCDDSRTPSSSDVTAFNAWWEGERNAPQPAAETWNLVERFSTASSWTSFVNDSHGSFAGSGPVLVTAGALVSYESR